MKFRILLGVLIILIGVAVIGNKISDNNLWSLISTYWPVILVFIGLDNLFSKYHSKFFAAFMIALGTLFLLGNLDIIAIRWYDLIFPSILIAIGIRILIPSKYFKSKKFIFDTKKDDVIIDNEIKSGFSKTFNYQGSSDEDIIENYNIFSGFETNITSQNFKGGEIGSIFGGSEIDLRQAKLHNNKAKLEVYAIFGGVDIIVPENWKVKVKGAPIFGGVDNKTNHDSSLDQENTPLIIIDAYAIFGGIDIKNLPHNN
jgi:predicted membrane protein